MTEITQEDYVRTMARELGRAILDVEELQEALWPLARLADFQNEGYPDSFPVVSTDGCRVKIGHARRARKLLRRLQAEKADDHTDG